jgi:phosphoserine phosphatase RsbU/P
MRLPFTSSAPAVAARQPRPAVLPDIVGASVAARYCADRTGGDFFDFSVTPTGRLLLLMADVAGTGEQTSTIVAAMQDVFHVRARELFADGDANESLALTELALHLNRGVMQSASGVRCTAAFLACYDPHLGAAWYINAGHTPALHIVANGDTDELIASGIPFGLFSHTTHDAQLVILQPQSCLVIASRGLVEMRAGGREFGIAGVSAAAAAHSRAVADDVCQAVLGASDRFLAELPVPRIQLGHRQSRHPDRTVLAIVRTV